VPVEAGGTTVVAEGGGGGVVECDVGGEVPVPPVGGVLELFTEAGLPATPAMAEGVVVGGGEGATLMPTWRRTEATT
jgi:hypothetical protein